MSSANSVAILVAVRLKTCVESAPDYKQRKNIARHL